jgi:hypothetical protein
MSTVGSLMSSVSSEPSERSPRAYSRDRLTQRRAAYGLAQRHDAVADAFAKFSIVPSGLAIRLAYSDIWSKGCAMPLVFGGDNGRLAWHSMKGGARRNAPLSPECCGSMSTAGLRNNLYLFSSRTGSWRSRQSSSHVNENGGTPAKAAAPFNRNSLGPTVECVANIGRTARTRNTRNWTARLLEPIELVFPLCWWRGTLPRVDDTGFFVSFRGGFPSRANAAVGHAQNQDMNGDCSLSGRYTDAGRLAPDIGHLGDTI